MEEINFEEELYKAFGQVRDFSLGMRIAARFYEMGRNYKISIISENLEKEFSRFLDEKEGMPRMRRSDEQLEWALDIARHFAEWQKLEDEKGFGDLLAVAYQNGLENGLNLMEQKMLRDAIPAEAHPMDKEIWCDFDKFNLKEGENIEVIIIKED